MEFRLEMRLPGEILRDVSSRSILHAAPPFPNVASHGSGFISHGDLHLRQMGMNPPGVILQATSTLCHDRPSPVIVPVTSGIRGLSHASTMTSPSFGFGNPGEMGREVNQQGAGDEVEDIDLSTYPYKTGCSRTCVLVPFKKSHSPNLMRWLEEVNRKRRKTEKDVQFQKESEPQDSPIHALAKMEVYPNTSVLVGDPPQHTHGHDQKHESQPVPLHMPSPHSDLRHTGAEGMPWPLHVPALPSFPHANPYLYSQMAPPLFGGLPACMPMNGCSHSWLPSVSMPPLGYRYARNPLSGSYSLVPDSLDESLLWRSNCYGNSWLPHQPPHHHMSPPIAHMPSIEVGPRAFPLQGPVTHPLAPREAQEAPPTCPSHNNLEVKVEEAIEADSPWQDMTLQTDISQHCDPKPMAVVATKVEHEDVDVLQESKDSYCCDELKPTQFERVDTPEPDKVKVLEKETSQNQCEILIKEEPDEVQVTEKEVLQVTRSEHLAGEAEKIDFSGLELLSSSIDRHLTLESEQSGSRDSVSVKMEPQDLNDEQEVIQGTSPICEESSQRMKGLGLLCALAEQCLNEESNQSDDPQTEEEREDANGKQHSFAEGSNLTDSSILALHGSYRSAKSEKDIQTFIANRVAQYHNSPYLEIMQSLKSPEQMDSMEMDMRERLMELQKQYREKQRELSRLTPKKEVPHAMKKTGKVKKAPRRKRSGGSDKRGKRRWNSGPPAETTEEEPIVVSSTQLCKNKEKMLNPLANLRSSQHILRPPTFTTGKLLEQAKLSLSQLSAWGYGANTKQAKQKDNPLKKCTKPSHPLPSGKNENLNVESAELISLSVSEAKNEMQCDKLGNQVQTKDETLECSSNGVLKSEEDEEVGSDVDHPSTKRRKLEHPKRNTHQDTSTETLVPLKIQPRQLAFEASDRRLKVRPTLKAEPQVKTVETIIQQDTVSSSDESQDSEDEEHDEKPKTPVPPAQETHEEVKPSPRKPLTQAEQESQKCVLGEEELMDGQRVLILHEGRFHPGRLSAIQPPDVYGVTIDGERGNRPHIYSREEILQKAIREEKPSSAEVLVAGVRICAYWSQQYRCLYPGMVSDEMSSPGGSIMVEFDDGDSGRIPIHHVRYLPPDYPIEKGEEKRKKGKKKVKKKEREKRKKKRRSSSDHHKHHGHHHKKHKKKHREEATYWYTISNSPPREPEETKEREEEKEEEMQEKENEDTNVVQESRHKDSTSSGFTSTEEQEREGSSPEDESSAEQEEPSKRERHVSETRSKMAAFLPDRQLWSWASKGYKRQAKGRTKKEFHKAIQRGEEIIRVGDCAVFLSTGRPDRPYIGQIEMMWEAWGGNMLVKVKWFYHPEEAKGGKKLCPTKGALFQSPHMDENDVQTISHKCEVLPYSEFLKIKTSESERIARFGPHLDSSDIYFLAGDYDPISGILTLESGIT
ncbi:unnamed protein product [Darwinula stevensoni]|uniref:BAH domain-containing protein n=1 Tax=Darwinula stevensoni TaxID=69355 RepID=A0A7R9A813_9CRUS|nr:unnamed protein product [Darwinula stevensoni]CAG0895995.1 unnamed protein product [Darwinula stevensoni]